MPGTAAGTVRSSARTVCSATRFASAGGPVAPDARALLYGECKLTIMVQAAETSLPVRAGHGPATCHVQHADT